MMIDRSYISIECRNGPINSSHRTLTDIFCFITFIILFLLTIIFCLVDSSKTKLSLSDVSDATVGQDVTKGLLVYELEVFLTSLVVVSGGLILMALTFLLPKVMGYLTIVLFNLLLGYFSFLFFYWFAVGKSSHSAKGVQFMLGILFAIALIYSFYSLFNKRAKIAKLGNFLRICGVGIKKNITGIIIVYLCMSAMQISCWWMMTRIYFVASSLDYSAAVNPIIMMAMTILTWMWLNGLLIAASDYINQSLIIHWYFQKNNPNIISSSLRNLFKYHLGTIAYGSFLAYTPDFVLKKIRKCINQSPTCYQHCSCLASLSKYGYFMTILQGNSFCMANAKTMAFRRQIKSQYSQLYMLGHLYFDMTKLLICLLAAAVAFLLILQKYQYQLDSMWGVILPIAASVVILFISLGENIGNVIGVLGDVLLMLYGLDLQIERTFYGNNQPYSCDQDLMEVLRSLSVTVKWDGHITNQ